MGDCANPRRPRQPATARGRAIRGRVPRPRVGPAFGGRTAAAVREVTPTPRARPATTNRAGLTHTEVPSWPHAIPLPIRPPFPRPTPADAADSRDAPGCSP